MSHPIELHCHKCGAEPAAPCMGKRGPRRAYHRARGGRSSITAVTAHRLRTDSPLEELLTSNILGWIDHYGMAGVDVSTQTPVGPYRADIMVEVGDRKLVAECDGATYHNNPRAIAYDKRRDRYFALHGITVMRFTGDEINRDPRGCAAEIGMWILRR